MAPRDTEQIMTERSADKLPSAQGSDEGLADLGLPPIAPLAHEPESDGTSSSLRAKGRRLFDRARLRVVFWSRSLLVRVVVLTLSLSTIVMVTLGIILQQQITTGLLRSKIDAATAEIDSARQTVQSSLSGADSDPSSLREQLRLALAEI